MRYLLLFTAIYCSTLCHAQSRAFFGRVVDGKKQGIPFAVVEAKGRNEGVYCDENGVFAFRGEVDSIRTLLFYCLGYEKRELSTAALALDSIIVTMDQKVATLKEVAIRARKDDILGTLGKNKREQSYIGDCYRYYGSETAIRLEKDMPADALLKDIYVFITNEGAFGTRFRVHVYELDSLPTNEITDSNVIVTAAEGNTWVRIDLGRKHIPVGKGLFVSVEWISGFGNSTHPMQSGKNPEVTHYNGQVLGLTADYGRRSITYSRKPFRKDWEYFNSPTAQRKEGYFLNPMIYCTYTY